MAIIIGISGISGAGTTTITKALGKTLNATTLFWDDFDDISEAPDDYVEWFYKSGDFSDWKYPALERTLHELKEGHDIRHPATGEMLVTTPIIIFDSSLGRKHEATGKFIDFLIHLDTSMDVALARRLIRDYGKKEKTTAKKILEELEWYLKTGRPLFDATLIKQTADFIISGNLSTDEIINIISGKLKELSNIHIRELHKTDIGVLVESFAHHRWEKPRSTFEKYLDEQSASIRQTWVAFFKKELAGYITLNWQPNYEPFSKSHIPEIMDLNVLPPFRKIGVGTALLDIAEKNVARKSPIVGIGVGLYEGYGDAQKLYVKRGYIPDGQGPTYRYTRLSYGQSVKVDDDLVIWFTKRLSS